MSLEVTLLIIFGYFALLLVVAIWTGRGADTQTFFTANRSSPWYVVAFGMIGASLSGVTFISVPGAVGNGSWHYLQMVIGYLPGYAVIALVLMPLYYRLKLTSIYGYLRQRFGWRSYKSGAVLFLISRVIGASLRLYLVALVLQLAICDQLGIPFPVTVLISIALIYLYTFRGGIRTVVWTDTLQTAAMLVAAGVAVGVITQSLELDIAGLYQTLQNSTYTHSWVWDWQPGDSFWKQFLSGAFIAIVMTGLDQDMMQKNLTCRSLGEAQKNVFWFSVVLVLANLLFLTLGALLYIYGEATGLVEPVFTPDCAIRIADPETGMMVCHKTDELFPFLSLNYLGPVVGTCFLIGVIAAAYSSADSALTALTTSFCVDILGIENWSNEAKRRRIRMRVHIGFAVLLFMVILVFSALNNDAVIWEIFTAAGYTYGPLLGLYSFGLFTKLKINDRLVPWICVLAPLITYGVQKVSPALIGYKFGFEILLLNGLLTFLGLFLSRQD